MPIGPPELLLILLIVVIFFGLGKLPQAFRQLGSGVKEFRDAAEGKDGTTTPPATTPTATTTAATPTTTTVTPSQAATEKELQEVRDTVIKQ